MLHSIEPAAALQSFVDRLTSRSILSAAEQQSILSLRGTVVQVERNRDYVCLGEIVDHTSFVIAGLVGRFDENTRGERQITALHIAGDMPDLHSVVQPKSTSALQALSTATLLRVPHVSLRHLAGTNPAIGEAFWRDTMVDSMILAQWVVNVGRRDAKSRIAHLLCEMASRYEARPKDNRASFKLAMSQSHMADTCGITPVHVNRSLMALRNDGTTFKTGRVRIEDWEKLVTVADFDPSYLQRDLNADERIRIVA